MFLWGPHRVDFRLTVEKLQIKQYFTRLDNVSAWFEPDQVTSHPNLDSTQPGNYKKGAPTVKHSLKRCWWSFFFSRNRGVPILTFNVDLKTYRSTRYYSVRWLPNSFSLAIYIVTRSPNFDSSLRMLSNASGRYIFTQDFWNFYHH